MAELRSICVYCGSNSGTAPEYAEAARTLGRTMAEAGIQLVYGGGSIGLMGLVARTVLEHGGFVTGIIPQFLRDREVMLHEVSELIVTADMHERKRIMFERSNAFVALPGGIGTLEEVVELLSWRRLDLHAKPVVFYNPRGFWEPLFRLFQHTVDERLTPPDFMQAWVAVDTMDQIVPALLNQGREAYPSEAAVGRRG
ncbi:MAG: TIGR00730 family Rossman fold protein [Phenylobacterium sp.]|nr:TIGR00730 family Rossman fold protein [Phenylobacterium sp.]